MATVTTVIPTFRRPDLLPVAILSVLAQSYRDLQVFVVDDASGDETSAIVAEFARRDPRVHYLCRPQNLGNYLNTARAVASVSSPFFTILNDDDFLAPEFFATAIRAFERYPQAQLFVGRLFFWALEEPERSQMLLSLSREGLYLPPEAMLELLALRQHHTWTSTMFRREVLNEVGGIDVEVGDAADLEFILRQLANFPAVFSREPCAIYRYSSRSYYHDWLTPFLPSMQAILEKFSTDQRFDEDCRARMLAGIKDDFRHLTLFSAAHELTRGAPSIARQASIFLGKQLDAQLSAFGLRLAARCGPMARVPLRVLARIRRLTRNRSVYTEIKWAQGVLARLGTSVSTV